MIFPCVLFMFQFHPLGCLLIGWILARIFFIINKITLSGGISNNKNRSI